MLVDLMSLLRGYHVAIGLHGLDGIMEFQDHASGED